MTFSSTTHNRPYKFGQNDRREYIVQNSEVALRCENDANGNVIYVGRAKVGTATSDDMWQIVYLTYDGNNAVTSATWPQNDEGIASSAYEYVWDDRATYTYS